VFGEVWSCFPTLAIRLSQSGIHREDEQPTRRSPEHDMSLSSTVLIDDPATDAARYTVHVKFHDRWICATHLDSLRDAELVAEAAYRRSGLPIEVRAQDRTLVMAFEPASEADEEGTADSGILQTSTL
jgi:hypothetical protein